MSINNVYLRGLLNQIESRYSEDSRSMSMSDWVCTNTTIRGRPFSMKGFEFQRQILDDMHPQMTVKKCSQIGLALALDTPVPTPSGWSTMGGMRIGDQVFDEKGQPCSVEYVSPIYNDHVCYRLTFDTGDTIVADAGHRWYVECHSAFDMSGSYTGRGRPLKSVEMFRGGVITTEQIYEFHKHGKDDNWNRFAIPNTLPLKIEEAALPVDPYFLGLWLGDGNSHSCIITSHKTDCLFYQAELKRRGMICLPSSEKDDVIQFRVHLDSQKIGDRGTDNSLSWRLTCLGLGKGVKFIPDIYLRSSVSQRLDLLRGLLDTDGSITNKGVVSFHNTSPELISAAQELIHSLGFKTHTRWRMRPPSIMKNGRRIVPKKPVADVNFVAYADDGVFLLPRKRERLKSRAEGRENETLRRRIVSVEPIPSVPVRCIAVNSSSHLFLAGRGMIPTHNTEVEIRKALAFLLRYRGTSLIFTLPNEKLYEKISKSRIRPLVEHDKVFNPINEGPKPTRTKEILQFGDSFLYVTGCTEADATSTSADAVFNDEVDLSPQNMLALFNSRLQASDWKIRQGFSTPTFPDFGIDSAFQTSDQHLYLVRCEACSHWQWPEFTRRFIDIPGLPDYIEHLTEIDDLVAESLDILASQVVCEKCRRPLDLADPSLREWVPKYPARRHSRGYHVSPFSTSRLDVPYILGQLLQYKRLDHLRGFHNTVLGSEYSDGNIRLDRATIEACLEPGSLVPEVDAYQPQWVGIDMGQTCHLTRGVGTSHEQMRVVEFRSVHIDDLSSVIKDWLAQYNIVGGAVDRHPYEPNAQDLFRLSEGRIVPVQYRGTKEISLVKTPTGELECISADRTMMIDEVVRQIKRRTMSMTGYGHHREVVIEHLCDMARDETPGQPARWVKLTGNDHFFHALAFLLFATKIKEVQRALDKEDRRTGFYASAIPFGDYGGSLLGRKTRFDFDLPL